MVLEVRQNFVLAAGLLGRMSEYLDAGVFLQESCFGLVLVRVGAGGVGYYEQLGAGISSAELLEFVLLMLGNVLE